MYRNIQQSHALWYPWYNHALEYLLCSHLSLLSFIFSFLERTVFSSKPRGEERHEMEPGSCTQIQCWTLPKDSRVCNIFQSLMLLSLLTGQAGCRQAGDYTTPQLLAEQIKPSSLLVKKWASSSDPQDHRLCFLRPGSSLRKAFWETLALCPALLHEPSLGAGIFFFRLATSHGRTYRFQNWEQEASFNLKICRLIKLRRRKTWAADMCKGRRGNGNLTWLLASTRPWQAGEALKRVWKTQIHGSPKEQLITNSL